MYIRREIAFMKIDQAGWSETPDIIENAWAIFKVGNELKPKENS